MNQKEANAVLEQWQEDFPTHVGGFADQIIVSPGRYEGEPLYAAYFDGSDWDDSAYDEEADRWYYVYKVTANDRKIFSYINPITRRRKSYLTNVRYVVLTESSCGFVYSFTYRNRAELIDYMGDLL